MAGPPKGLRHEAVVTLDVAAVAPGGDAARQVHLHQPEPVVEKTVAVRHRTVSIICVQLRRRDDPPVEQCGDERRQVLVGGDDPAGHARRGRVEVGDVCAAPVLNFVAVRERLSQSGIAGAGK